MTENSATEKDAAQTSDEAGVAPPFDARCVTFTVGSLPPQSRAECDPFGRVPELSAKTARRIRFLAGSL